MSESKNESPKIPALYLDADSLPRKVRDIAIKAGFTRGVKTYIAANRPIPYTPRKGISMNVITGQKVDDWILEKVCDLDMVITRDIPLAEVLVHKGVTVINHKGTLFVPDTVSQRRSMRDKMQELREKGLVGRGTDSFSEADVKQFADTFDRELTRLINYCNALNAGNLPDPPK